MPCTSNKRLPLFVVIGLVTSIIGLEIQAADWYDEETSVTMQNVLAEESDIFTADLNDGDLELYLAYSDENDFLEENRHVGDLDDRTTTADPVSYRPRDRKKRPHHDRHETQCERCQRKKDWHRRAKMDRCPCCWKHNTDFRRHAYRGWGAHGPRTRAHGPAGSGSQHLRRGARAARAAMQRLARLEHKVDILIRITRRSHAQRGDRPAKSKGYRHSKRHGEHEKHSDCEKCKRHRKRTDRPHGHHRKKKDSKRHHHSTWHGEHYGSQPERPQHSEWDAPPSDSWDHPDDDRSAWHEFEWEEIYEEDAHDDYGYGDYDYASDEVDLSQEHGLSIVESIEQLEHYFNAAFDGPLNEVD